MNREILFRGKNEEGWFYGNLLIYADTAQIWYEEKGYGKVNVLVDPSTIGQYTGLTDRNGVKIFEGDIIKYRSEIFEVIYSATNARFLALRPNGVFNAAAMRNCEIIGNIHDNPELLQTGI